MSESEIMRNQPLSCTALQQSNHPRVNSNIALNSKTRVDARQRKRREDAHALPKLSRNERDASTNFARSAFYSRNSSELECDASSHRFRENSNCRVASAESAFQSRIGPNPWRGSIHGSESCAKTRVHSQSYRE